jgi:serine protease Do
MLGYLKNVGVAILLVVALAGATLVQGAAINALRPVDTTAATVLIDTGEGKGSGVHIGGGYIVTAAHVVDTAAGNTITVRYEGGEAAGWSAQVVGYDKKHDLALLHIEDTSGPSASISCEATKIGQSIQIVGNPLDMEFIHTFGRVGSGVRAMAHWAEAFIGNAVTGPGNSGGPVFDARGRVVGILVGGYMPVVVAPGPMGLRVTGIPLPGWSFIVPSTTLCRLMGRTS